MKRYNDNYDCAHSWAHQHAPHGIGSNFYFQGPVIYSYGAHFPIAYLHGNTVYFTTRGYSRTTARHKHLVRSAISHKKVIYVGEVPTSATMLESNYWWSSNLNYFLRQLKEQVAEYQLHPRRVTLLRNIEDCRYQVREFLAATGHHQLPQEIAEMLATPTAQGMAAILEQQRKREVEAEILRYKKAIIAFRKHQRRDLNNFDASVVDANQTYLRYNIDTHAVETSKGIALPVEEARRFWYYILGRIQTGETVVNYTIQGFDVESITPQQFTVGCHTIAMKEARALAKKLGW